MEERDWPPTIAHDSEEFCSPLKELTEKRTNYDARGTVVGERAARSEAAAAVCIGAFVVAEQDRRSPFVKLTSLLGEASSRPAPTSSRPPIRGAMMPVGSRV